MLLLSVLESLILFVTKLVCGLCPINKYLPDLKADPKIVKVDYFLDQPAVLMLGMLCALIGSSTWLTIATSLGMPVSTTHCIVGGVIGMGVATLGKDGVVWGWNGKGVAQIVASWVIAPGISGAFAAVIFLLTKYLVLKRSNPLKWGFVMVPIWFAVTSGILTMLIVWKGVSTTLRNLK